MKNLIEDMFNLKEIIMYLIGFMIGLYVGFGILVVFFLRK